MATDNIARGLVAKALAQNTPGQIGGPAGPLDANGKIPAQQVPDIFDDIINGAMNAEQTIFTDTEGNVVIPTEDNLYFDIDTKVMYAWNSVGGYVVTADPRNVLRYTEQVLTNAQQTQARTNIGLGTAATANTGTAAGTVPVIEANGKLSANIIPGGSGGAVDSVNGKTGVVELTLNDLGVTATTEEVNRLSGVTDNVQSELDNKVNKIIIPSKVYGTSSTGAPTSYGIESEAYTRTIPFRTSTGDIIVPLAPAADKNAASKSYVDTNIATKVTATNVANRIYGTNGSGEQTNIGVDIAASASVIPVRNSNGDLLVPMTPSTDNVAVSKAYVTTEVNKKVNKAVNIAIPIAVDAWSTLSPIQNKYNAQYIYTFTDEISSDAIIELFNNAPVIFSQYGFAIAAATTTTLTIYSINIPATEVVLTVGVTE